MAIEHAAACVLSAAAVMLLSPWICRSWENSRVFSAAQGIILYAIVKSIIVECGWGFAAAAGVRPGLMLEAIAMCGGLTIFGELGDDADRSGACTVKRRIRHRQSVRRRSCYRCGLHCLQRRSACGRKVGNLLCGSLSGGELCGGISSASGGNRSPFASGSVSDYDELLRADVCFFARDEKRPAL